MHDMKVQVDSNFHGKVVDPQYDNYLNSPRLSTYNLRRTSRPPSTHRDVLKLSIMILTFNSKRMD